MDEKKNELSTKAKNLGSWLGIELKITLFGVTVLNWKYPPESTNSVDLIG